MAAKSEFLVKLHATLAALLAPSGDVMAMFTAMQQGHAENSSLGGSGGSAAGATVQQATQGLAAAVHEENKSTIDALQSHALVLYQP